MSIEYSLASPELVRELVADPRHWEIASDDFMQDGREEWQPATDSRVLYVAASDQQGAIGLYTLVCHNAVMWEMHCTQAFGSRAEQAARGLIQRMFETTQCRRIIALIPAYNRLAVRHAERCGLKRFAVNERSVMKHGELHDQIFLGISA